jgi:hypothetical protein
MSMAAEKLARTSLSGSRGAAVTGGRNFQSHRAPLAVTLLDAGIYLDSALCSALADRSTLRASTVENFIRAESDLYMSAVALKEDGFGKFEHHRELSPIDAQNIYNADGYFQKNDLNAYSLNNITSKKSSDGSVAIQFGGCDGKIPNCLPVMNGWNYTVRLYRPRAEILNGTWKFPEPQPVN